MSVAGLWRRALRMKEMQVWAVGLGILIWRLGLHPPSPAILAGGLVAGAGSWFASEYFLHRFALHMPVPSWPPLRRLHARLHWQHHQSPDRPEFLFIPLWSSVGLHAIAGGLGFAVGGVALAISVVTGFALAFGHYELAHLAAHVPYHPRTRLGRLMKRHHLLHHFKNERFWFGVTNPVVDKLLGTWKRRADVEKSETARTLGIDPD